MSYVYFEWYVLILKDGQVRVSRLMKGASASKAFGKTTLSKIGPFKTRKAAQDWMDTYY